jgi:transcriptional regulator with XRE-family HTH domain
MSEPGVGELLRAWRTRRRRSQLDVAVDAGVSTRHLSFVETGKARPSREMVLLLAECLDVPLRERNELLLAAGFAPAYRERRLDDPDMATVRTSLEHIIEAQEPYPAVVVDRRWDAVLANQAAQVFLVDVDPSLLLPAPNVFRLSLHPDGLGGRILNFQEYAGHVLGRLQRLVLLTGDEHLAALLDEVLAFPGVAEARHHVEAPNELVLPLRLRVGDDVLSLCSTVATFGTAVDITLSELSVESFLPADEMTAEILRRRALAQLEP